MLQDAPAALPPGLVTWLRPADRDEAIALVSAAATPVGGGAALLSQAFPISLSDRAVDVLDLLPCGLNDGVLGAASTIADLASDSEVRRRWPAVAQAGALTATPQVRAVATLGGTVAARLPTSDLAAPLAAYDCTVVLETAADRREIDVLEYLSAPVLPPHLVVGVRPRLSGPGAYRRFARQVGPAPAIATVAGVRTGGELRLYAGAVGPTAAPLRLDGDQTPGECVRSDARADAGYRRQLIAVLAGEVCAELGAAV
jgi:CO/xanthine dehydrogenase FAD-binding subunit